MSEVLFIGCVLCEFRGRSVSEGGTGCSDLRARLWFWGDVGGGVDDEYAVEEWQVLFVGGGVGVSDS